MELAEYAVEQVPQRPSMPVPGRASAPVVGVGSWSVGECGEGPQISGVVEPVFFTNRRDVLAFAGDPGDRYRARVCLQPVGGGKAGAVIADLCSAGGRRSGGRRRGS